MQLRNWEDFVQVDADGRFVDTTAKDYSGFLEARLGDILAQGSVIESHPGGALGGSLGTEQGDFIEVEMVAGQTYTFSYRGTDVGGIVDPYLVLFNAGGVYVTEDDDGGYGRTSQITYTATQTGTHYLFASSWYHLDPSAPGYPTADTGNYTITQWSPVAGHDAGNTIATAGTIAVGTNYEYLETAGDRDYYAINLTAGQVYTFTYNGGVASSGDWDDEPGESLGVLGLYNSAGGAVVGLTVNYETSITFVAQTTGTYYLRAEGYSNFIGGPAMTGGYTIDVVERAFEDFDPLESLRWDSADDIDTVDVGGVPTAYVYFGAAGETFGENLPFGSLGWTATQMAAVMNVLQNEYTPITGIQYLVTTNVEEAEFRMLTTAIPPGTPGAYGARFYPQDPAYGTQQGIGTFNLNSGGFSLDASLVEGGFSYAVIMHEFGHAHGIAHPHDTGGGSEVMLGVTAAQGSFGLFNLNQGVYTVMSYNDAWQLHPDGPAGLFLNNLSYGWSGSLSAFDIAVLQERYGVHEHNHGDTVYHLTDVVTEASYQTIWDSGGNDSIAYDGALDARIDLTAATLDYSPTGGGAISFLYNDPEDVATTHPVFLVHGGYTIANGVVIENASGGSGDDVLIGNSAGNALTGNAGDDVLMGRAGNDRLIAGAGDDIVYGGDGLDVITLGDGDDIFVAEIGTAKEQMKKASMPVDIITDFDASGNDVIDVSGLGSFHFNGTKANKNAGDLTYKTYDSVTGAENALGFDIDGQDGAGGVSGPVTIVYGNVDGGAADFAIILMNTSSVDASDFLFA